MGIIDFRIYDEEKNTMVHSVDHEIDKDSIKFYFNKNNTDMDIEDIMLYSTLKDDVGLKIYDGDIVKVHNERESEKAYISIVTVDMINGTTITPHPYLQKMGITYPVPLKEYITPNKSIRCIKIGNIGNYPYLLDEIDKELEEALKDANNDKKCEVFYSRHVKFQERFDK